MEIIKSKKRPGNLGMYSTVIDDAIIICGGFVNYIPVDRCTRLTPHESGQLIAESIEVGPDSSSGLHSRLLERQFACTGSAKNGNSTSLLVAQGNFGEQLQVVGLQASEEREKYALKLTVMKDRDEQVLFGPARKGGIGAFVDHKSYAGLLCVGGYSYDKSEVQLILRYIALQFMVVYWMVRYIVEDGWTLVLL